MAPYLDTSRDTATPSRTTACMTCPNRNSCFGRIYCTRKQTFATVGH